MSIAKNRADRLGAVTRAVPWVAFAIALAVLPYMAGALTVFVVIEILIFGLAATGLNLLLGQGQMVSFGHAAWFGLGAYGVGVTLQRVPDIGIPLALVIAMLVAGVGAAIVGVLCVQRGHIYFAILTLAFAQIVELLVRRTRGLTGGEQGLTGGVPRPAIGPWEFVTIADLYYLIAGVVFLGLLAMRVVFVSPFGLSLKAISNDPERARACGIAVRTHQWLAFVVTGVCGGLAGGLHALFLSAAFPEQLHWSMSAVFLVIVLVGGMKRFEGPLLGAALFVLLNRYATTLFESRELMLGLALLLIVIFFPQGVSGIFDRTATWLRWLLRTAPATPVDEAPARERKAGEPVGDEQTSLHRMAASEPGDRLREDGGPE